MKEEKAGNKSINILLIIICILSLAAAIFANYRVVKLSNEYKNELQEKENNKEETKEDKKEDKENNEEKELSDALVIKDLQTKQDILHHMEFHLGNIYTHIYDKESKASELTDKEKITSVLYYSFAHGYTSKGFNRDFPKMKFMLAACGEPDESPDSVRKYVTYSNMLNTYKFVYSETPSKVEFGTLDSNTGTYYSTLIYSKDYDTYFYQPDCGTCGATMHFFNEKYTEDKDNYYIYTIVGYSTCEPYIYKDYDMKEVGVDLSNNGNNGLAGIDENIVMKGNSDKLYHYKIVFKKDGSNSYFDKVERIK